MDPSDISHHQWTLYVPLIGQHIIHWTCRVRATWVRVESKSFSHLGAVSATQAFAEEGRVFVAAPASYISHAPYLNLEAGASSYSN